MKKYLLSAGLLLSTTPLVFAQNINLKGPAQNLANELKGVFPYVAVAIFIVVILTQLGHFTKDNGDWKKGVTNIILFAVILSAVVGLISYVSNIKI